MMDERERRNIMTRAIQHFGETAQIDMAVEEMADLMVAGEVCRSYDPADLCFLELNELMMLRMLKTRKEE